MVQQLRRTGSDEDFDRHRVASPPTPAVEKVPIITRSANSSPFRDWIVALERQSWIAFPIGTARTRAFPLDQLEKDGLKEVMQIDRVLETANARH